MLKVVVLWDMIWPSSLYAGIIIQRVLPVEYKRANPLDLEGSVAKTYLCPIARLAPLVPQTFVEFVVIEQALSHMSTNQLLNLLQNTSCLTYSKTDCKCDLQRDS